MENAARFTRGGFVCETRAVKGEPRDAPLGAKPVLPEPSGKSARRGREIFEQMVARGASAPAAPRPRPTFAGGRRYDLALSVVEAAIGVPPGDLSAEVSAPSAAERSDDPNGRDPQQEVAVDAASARIEEALPARPPLGAPTVRPTARAPKRGSAAGTQEIMEATASSALLVSDPDGSSTFEFSIRDELFADVDCRVSLEGGLVVATFRVGDKDLKRLFEAEAGRLRVQLEERGLRVQEVRVEAD